MRPPVGLSLTNGTYGGFDGYSRRPRRCDLHRARQQVGNPFRVGVDGDRATVIAKYERWLRSQDHLLRARDELRDRDLLCFCAPAHVMVICCCAV